MHWAIRALVAILAGLVWLWASSPAWGIDRLSYVVSIAMGAIYDTAATLGVKPETRLLLGDLIRYVLIPVTIVACVYKLLSHIRLRDGQLGPAHGTRV